MRHLVSVIKTENRALGAGGMGSELSLRIGCQLEGETVLQMAGGDSGTAL